MIATFINAIQAVADFARFLADVWRDARVMQNEAEDRYGLMGF